MKKHEQLGEVSSVALVAVSAIVWGSGRAVLVGIDFCALGKEGQGGCVEGGVWRWVWIFDPCISTREGLSGECGRYVDVLLYLMERGPWPLLIRYVCSLLSKWCWACMAALLLKNKPQCLIRRLIRLSQM